MGKRKQSNRWVQSQRFSSSRQAPNVLRKSASLPEAKASVTWKERALLIAFWGYVLIPLAWGVYSTAQKALMLFPS
jgi:hypothetical protein